MPGVAGMVVDVAPIGARAVPVDVPNRFLYPIETVDVGLPVTL